MALIPGQRVISGSKGTLSFNGVPFGEVKSIESTATINRETVQMAGEGYNEDSKVMSISCEGSFVLNKVYTREREFIEAMQKGVDTRFSLFITLNDPDSFGRESVQLDNCWFNEIPIVGFEMGSILEREFPFGHTYTDIKYKESINA